MQHDPAALQKMAEAYAAAWTSKSAEAVASFYAEDGYIIINRGEPWKGRKGLAEMAGGFMADFPDMVLHCDLVRGNEDGHALFAWTLEGTHAGSGNRVKASGWEEWELDRDLNRDLKVKASLGWFDAEDYARQVEGR